MASVVLKPLPLAPPPQTADPANVENLRSELDALQRERRVAELRLRDLDAKRRMVPIASRLGPRDLSRPGGPWISDRDRDRRDFDRGGHDRDRPHPWDSDRNRDHDRPHPWDVRKGSDDRKPSVLSSVTRAGDSHDNRGLKRSSGDGDDEWKQSKRRIVEGNVAEKEDGETERFEGDIKRKDDDYEPDDGADLHDRDADDGRSDPYHRSGRRAQLSSVVSRKDDDGKRERRRETRPDREKPKVPLSENTEIKSRNRKMFGALLGHLQKAKKEEEKILQTPTMQKRVEIEEKVEVLARESGEVLRRKLTEEMREERRKNLEQIRMVRSRQQAALHLLAITRIDTQCKSLSSYIRTAATPEIFWRPVHPTEAKILPLLAKTQEQLRAAAAETKLRLNAERAADLEAEAAAQAQRQAIRERSGGHEEEEEEHHDAAHAAAETEATAAAATAPKEQAVEEVDEEEGPVDVEIAF